MKSLNVNGEKNRIGADGATPWLWILREQLGVTGTKYS
jgi:isoquinoline 1-oxidoreductase alpha subunit